MELDTKQHKLKVLMFPWLAHGHISPFLELAKRLSLRNIKIYFCSTPVNLTSINNTSSISPSLQLVELHLPSLPDLPPHYHTTKSLPLHLMPTLKNALDMAKPSFFNLLKTLSPDLLIYDFIQPWAPSLASSLNIPSVAFLITGAATSAYFYNICKNPGVEFPFSAIKLHEHEVGKTAKLLNSSANGLTDRDRVVESIDGSSRIVLSKTFRDIEGKYIDYYLLLTGKELVGVGPLIKEPTEEDSKSEFVEWLDKKEKGSVVFVSFGTEYYLSKEEMEELAYGLELSGVNFIWVVRFPEGDDQKTSTSVDEALPKGFKERVREKGMVVSGWVPQSKILGHSSVGGFVSHCGSGSVMEGMNYGIPFIAIPMHLDQPMNAKLVVELGVGIEVKRDKSGRFVREEVEKVIKQVDKQGEEVSRRARQLGHKIRMNGEQDIDVVVEKLLQLCENRGRKLE